MIKYPSEIFKNHLLELSFQRLNIYSSFLIWFQSGFSFKCLRRNFAFYERLSLSITKLLRIFTNNRRNLLKIIYSNFNNFQRPNYSIPLLIRFQSQLQVILYTFEETRFFPFLLRRNRYKFLRIVGEIPGRNRFQGE